MSLPLRASGENRREQCSAQEGILPGAISRALQPHRSEIHQRRREGEGRSPRGLPRGREASWPALFPQWLWAPPQLGQERAAGGALRAALGLDANGFKLKTRGQITFLGRMMRAHCCTSWYLALISRGEWQLLPEGDSGRGEFKAEPDGTFPVLEGSGEPAARLQPLLTQNLSWERIIQREAFASPPHCPVSGQG